MPQALKRPSTSTATTDDLERLRSSGFLHPLRRSASNSNYNTAMPGYHNKFPNASTSALPSQPPEYKLHSEEEEPELPPSRFKIIPREEEGREELPAYSCTLHKEAVFERKMELSNPFERADKRRWKKVYLVLHGTKLDVHKPKRTMFFEKKSKTSGETEYTAGVLLESYTLQLAEVGTAADYLK